MRRKDVGLFLKYVVPSMAGMLIAGSFSIVDTIFLGHGIGKVGLAAVALTWPPLMLFGALGDMIGAAAALVGGAMFFCLGDLLSFLGATPEMLPDASAYARVIVAGSLFAMLMTGGISVVRADGSPFFAMSVVVIGLLGNVFLDWFFIFPLGMGATGAASATVVSEGLSCLALAWYFFSKRASLKISARDLAPSPGERGHGLSDFREHAHGDRDALHAQFPVVARRRRGRARGLHDGGGAGVARLAADDGARGRRAAARRVSARSEGQRAAEPHGQLRLLRGVRARRRADGLSFALHGVMPGWIGLSAPAFVLLGVVRVAGYYYQSSGKIFDASLLIYGDAFFALPLCLFTLPHFWGMDGIWLAMPFSRVILILMVCYLWFLKKRKARA